MSFVIDRLRKSVGEFPDRVAYKIKNQSITYREFIEKAEATADCLTRQGNSPVIIICDKSVENIISVFACLIAKRAYIPIDISTPAERVKKIISASDAELILSENINSEYNILCCNLSDVVKYSNMPKVKSMNETAYIIFTSGSTGEPKGVPVSYENLDNFSKWISSINPLNGYNNKNVLNHASFSFDLSVADIYYSFCNAHTLVTMSKEAKSDVFQSINVVKTENINVMVMTPTSAKMYLLDSDFNSRVLPSLECIFFCGETLESKTAFKLLERFANLKIINAYGPTECTCAVSASLIDKKTVEENDILPVGDIDSLATEVEIENGEIVIKGKSVFNGYLGINSEKCYCEDKVNCFKTGDIGYIKNNKLYCKGRKDRQIKYMGYRIELDDIESNINAINGVRACAVIAKFSDSKVKKISAFIEAESDLLNEKYVREKLKVFLPEYMLPKTIRIVDKLPTNSNQKIDRRALELL